MLIHQEATFPVSPDRIYELLTDGAKLSTLVERRGRGGAAEGTWFSLFGDLIEGRQIELVRDERVVQAWRLSEWEPGVYSIVRFTLTREGTGTRVVVDQDGYPSGLHQVLANNCWDPLYFEPMARHYNHSMGRSREESDR